MTRAAELLQGLGADPGRDVEHAVVGEQAVGREGVDMAIVPHVLAEGMNGHDHAEPAGGAVEAAAQELEQAFVGDPTELLQELAIVAEVDPQHDRRASTPDRESALRRTRGRGLARDDLEENRGRLLRSGGLVAVTLADKLEDELDRAHCYRQAIQKYHETDKRGTELSSFHEALWTEALDRLANRTGDPKLAQNRSTGERHHWNAIQMPR